MARSVLQSFVSGTRQMLGAQLFVSVGAVVLAGGSAFGLDAASVYVEDPSLLGCRGIIPRREFLERWHDYEGPPPYGPSRRAYVRMGLFIEGRPAHPAHPYCRVD